MSLQLVTDAGTIKVPGATVQTKVVGTAGGIGTSGVIALLGEASDGVGFASELDLNETCRFGSDQFGDVVAKYGAGPLVDAYAQAVAAADDPDIQGAPSAFVLAKTNAGVAATATVPNVAAGTWGTLAARRPGADGSLLSRAVTAAVAEVLPTTGAFTLLPPIAATDINFRVNGGSAVPYTIGVGDLPPTSVTGINALAGVAASGGADRGIIGSVTGTLALAVVSGLQVTVTRSVAWSVTPTVGDTLYLSATSAIKGGGNENAGAYVITAATATVISATKLLDTTGTPNQVTAPVGVGATPIASTTADARAFAPVTITLEPGAVVDGVGKSLEIAELTSASGRLSYLTYALTASVVTWVSKSTVPVVLASAAEYQANLNVARQKDSISEDIAVGGRVILLLGYLGTTATAVVASGTMTITVTGGSGVSPAAIALASFTVADLVAYLNTLTGFSAAVGATAFGQQPATSLDAGAFGVASTWGAKVGRIKQDAYLVRQAIAASPTVALTGTLPTSGSPAVAAATFFTGGAKGATSDAAVVAGLLKLEDVDCNFVVPLFSNDAAVDVADGLTDAASTYTVASVHAATRSHVLSQSTLKNYKPRQAFLSIRDTFANDKAAAQAVASFRCSMTHQDGRVSTSTGVAQLRPWITAAKAAGFQAAAFRRSIFNKGVNIVGAVQASGDFNPKKTTQLEQALDAGLLTLRPRDGGGWAYVSDQTTYSKDDNFFFNSIQAVYAGDIIGRTLKTRMEQALVGQSVADVGRSQALSVLRRILDDLRDLKLIAPSDGAPLGYLNEDVKIRAPAAFVSVGVFEATSLYFVPIQLSISAVSQTS